MVKSPVFLQGAVCGHGFTSCGYKREDAKNGKTWTIHPKRGQLLPKKTNSNRYLTYKRQQTAAAAAIVNFSEFVMSLSNEPRQQQPQQQQQDNPAAVAALTAELMAARAEVTAMRQQQQQQQPGTSSHPVSAAATTSKPQQPQERPETTKSKPQGGCFPKPPRPPSTPQVAQPGLPHQLTTEESYTILSDWAADSAEQTARIPPDQLYRQEREYFQLVQNLPTSREAEEEHDLWCNQ